MNERNVFVTNALNVVLAVTVLQHCWALKRLNRNDFGSVFILETITGCNGAGRPCR